MRPFVLVCMMIGVLNAPAGTGEGDDLADSDSHVWVRGSGWMVCRCELEQESEMTETEKGLVSVDVANGEDVVQIAIRDVAGNVVHVSRTWENTAGTLAFALIEVAKLKAENIRLREALEVIAKKHSGPIQHRNFPSTTSICKAALAKEDQLPCT